MSTLDNIVTNYNKTLKSENKHDETIFKMLCCLINQTSTKHLFEILQGTLLHINCVMDTWYPIMQPLNLIQVG